MLRFVAAIMFASCVTPDPGLRLDRPPHLAPSAEVDWAELSFDSSAPGPTPIKLYAQSWRPKVGDPRAVVVIHHGLADHSARYAPFAERLVRAGYAVWALDMRGHGRSGGPRVHTNAIDDYLADLDSLLHLVREREPNRPLYLFGHSLGGLISCLYTIERQPALAGLVLSGPGIAFDAPPLQAAAIQVIAALGPNAPLLATPHRDFSTSRDVIAEMGRDPLIYQGKGPARTARAAIDGTHRVWAGAERLTVPLLVVAGSIDKLVAPSGGRDLVARAGGTDNTFRLYDNLNHDLMHEPAGGAERVMGDIQGWLDAHVEGKRLAAPPLPTGRLKGDRTSSLTAIELDVRGESRDGVGATGGVRARFGLGPYVGGVDLRAGVFPNGRGALYEADLHAVGAGWHNHAGAALALTAGIGIGGLRGASATHIPLELTVDAPLGPLHGFVRGTVGWRLSGPQYAKSYRIADELSGQLGIRIGRDRRYWANVVAGGGPFIAFTYRALGGSELIGVAVGIDLSGAN